MRTKNISRYTPAPVFVMALVLFLSCMKTTGYQPDLPHVDIDSTNLPGSSQHTYLALGDSYTIGQSIPREKTFPVQAAAALRAQGYSIDGPEIIAVTGWTTADLLNALKGKSSASPYDMITLLIGVNNQYQGRSINEYREQLNELLNKALQLSGNRPEHIIVISIPDYSVTPFAGGYDMDKIADDIDRFNEVNQMEAASLHLKYVNITGESRKAKTDQTILANDGLHYSAKGYSIWVDKLLPVMKVILN